MRRFRAPAVLIALAGLSAVASVTLLPAASAATAKGTFFASFTFEDTTTCPGITITQSNEERDTFIELSPTSEHFQRHGSATLTANGKTLSSNFSATIILDPTTTVVKVVGTVYNIQVPGGGNLLLDAGNIVLDVSSDPPTVLHVGGPHQQFSGDVASLCEYLAAA
jgi:hypothetical protein